MKHNLGLQLTVGLKVVKSGVPEVINIRNKPLFPKPQGAFWSSSYVEGKSDWVRWCESEDHDVPDVWEGILIKPNHDANIITIDTLDDLLKLADKYAVYVPGIDFMHGYDFEQMQKDGIDAIHLTKEGQERTRYTEPTSLYGWDCESTCWLYPAFEVVGKVSFPSTHKGRASEVRPYQK